ncbi:conserved hypothetical protein [Vibrio crassostreae]|nr:conserved hypothetical protein [Vibrio crassostreae]CAK3958786.1 conserved hypothetical protein [Vibrio crassostreae]
MNWGPNDYEPSFSPVINIVTLPRITPKSTRKITSPDYPHDFSDVDDGVEGDEGDDWVRQG